MRTRNTTSGKTGQLTKITNNLDHNRNRIYEFDALGRLRTAKGGAATGAPVTANWTQAYTYDRYGNRTQVAASGVTANNQAVPTDGLPTQSYDQTTNRITTAGYEYDPAGNLIRGQGGDGTWQRYLYDAAGRLTITRTDTGTDILYNGYTSSRQRLFANDALLGLSWYVWGGSQVISEYKSNTWGSDPLVWKKSYIYAGSRLLSTFTKNSSSGETLEFHHPDRLGTKLVTNNTANTSFEQATLPFGTSLDAETTGTTNQRFTSYDRSTVAQLDYAVNRSYSAGQGRFTSPDPIGMGAASLGNPQSLNLYAYVQNNPIDFVDPTGLEKWIVDVPWEDDIIDTADAAIARAISYLKQIGGGGGNGGGHESGGGDDSWQSEVTEKLNTGDCRQKLNSLLNKLGVKHKKNGKTGFDALAETFMGGKGKIDEKQGGRSQYFPMTGRMNLNVSSAGDRGKTNIGGLNGAIATEFIHEALHGARRAGFSHEDIVKKISELEGINFKKLAENRRANDKSPQGPNDSSLFEQPMNFWISKHCGGNGAGWDKLKQEFSN